MDRCDIRAAVEHEERWRESRALRREIRAERAVVCYDHLHGSAEIASGGVRMLICVGLM